MPAFAEVPDHRREYVIDICLRIFSKLPAVRKLEFGFGISICVGGVIGLTIGFLKWGFSGAIMLMTVAVFSVCALYAFIFHRMWKKWVHHFSMTHEFELIKIARPPERM